MDDFSSQDNMLVSPGSALSKKQVSSHSHPALAGWWAKRRYTLAALIRRWKVAA